MNVIVLYVFEGVFESQHDLLGNEKKKKYKTTSSKKQKSATFPLQPCTETKSGRVILSK